MAGISYQFLAALCLLIVADAATSRTFRSYMPKLTPSLAESCNDFAFALHKTLPRSGNIVFSPWSLFYALGMISLGADGNTLKEMQDSMLLGHMQPESVHFSFKQLRDHLVRYDQDYEMNMFATVLVQEKSDVSPVYKLRLQRYYDADIHDVDFVELGQLVTQWINVWTSLKTSGKIKEVMTTVPHPDTVMLLVTVNYFRGVWEEAFNVSNTAATLFYNNDKSTKMIEMMFATRNFSSYQGNDLSVYAVDIPMKGDISFLFIMPEKMEDFDQLQSNLSSAFFVKLYEKMYETTLELGIPKFQASSRLDLRDSLKSLGMSSLFSGDADLGQISGSKTLYVNEVIHKASVELNEEGAVATSVNVVSVIAKIKAERVVFDRPFVFLIRDKKSGIILFMGRISQL